MSIHASDDVTAAASASVDRAAPTARFRLFASTRDRLMVAVLLVLGGYHFLLTASTIFSYTLRYPFMDQFRGNFRYLTLPFPQSVFELENGHHPIIPGIVRVIDLEWSSGMPTLQTWTGWIAGILALAIVVREVRRGLRGSELLQAAAVCIVFTLIGWNANARNFIHPHETVQILLPLLFVLAAIALVVRGSVAFSWPIWLVAIILCAMATFSFGVGLASFGALFAIAIVQRRDFRVPLLIAVAAAASLLIYFFVLPGAAGVQGNVGASRALVFFLVARLGAVFVEILRVFDPPQFVSAMVAWLAAAIAIVSVALSVMDRWRRRLSFSELEAFAIGVFMFGFIANALIAASRTAYFFDYPRELFADRYLIWSCVAWSGVTIYALAQLKDASLPARYIAVACVVAFSALALPRAIWANLWSAAVYRIVESDAVAQRLGLRNDAQIPSISDEGPVPTYRSMDEMRKRRVAVYAERSTLRLGDRVEFTTPSMTLNARVANVEMSGSGSVRALSGRLRDEPAHSRSSELWFATNDGTLIGRAAITFGVPRNRLWVGAPKWVGFDGYIPQSDASDVTLLAAIEGVITPIARLELRQ